MEKISEMERNEIEKDIKKYVDILIEKQELEEKMLFSKKYQHVMRYEKYNDYLKEKLGREYFEDTIFHSSSNKAIVFKQLLEKKQELINSIPTIPDI